MSIQAINRCKIVFNPNMLIVKANDKAAEMLGCSKGVKNARFMVNPLYIAENPEMLLSPYRFVSEIKKGVEIMKAAEASGRYRDISNELL